MPVEKLGWRFAMESIFMRIAREAVEQAEKHEKENSAFVNMQNSSITAIIMSAMLTEAFINVIAEEQLTPTLWNAVERLNVLEKWILVTKLITDKEWDKGSQPFQNFSELIRPRNDLAHYKPKLTTDKLNLEGKFTGVLARRYFSAACDMIKEFYEKAGQEVPKSLQPNTSTRGYEIVNID
jgi:hypothetical protein